MEDKEEHQEHHTESIETDTTSLTSMVAKGLRGHQWIQRGPWIICRSCPIEHATWIGHKKLKGYKETGEPDIG